MARAVRENMPDARVTGYDQSEAVRQRARELDLGKNECAASKACASAQGH